MEKNHGIDILINSAALTSAGIKDINAIILVLLKIPTKIFGKQDLKQI